MITSCSIRLPMQGFSRRRRPIRVNKGMTNDEAKYVYSPFRTTTREGIMVGIDNLGQVSRIRNACINIGIIQNPSFWLTLDTSIDMAHLFCDGASSTVMQTLSCGNPLFADSTISSRRGKVPSVLYNPFGATNFILQSMSSSVHACQRSKRLYFTRDETHAYTTSYDRFASFDFYRWAPLCACVEYVGSTVRD